MGYYGLKTDALSMLARMSKDSFMFQGAWYMQGARTLTPKPRMMGKLR